MPEPPGRIRLPENPSVGIHGIGENLKNKIMGKNPTRAIGVGMYSLRRTYVGF